MKLSGKQLTVIIVVAFLCQSGFGQETINLYDKILQFPDRLVKKVNDKVTDLHQKLTKQSDKYLEKLANQEGRLNKKLAKKDSLSAIRIFGDAQQQYADLRSRINGVSSKAPALTKKASSLDNKYFPHLDSLKTVLSFLSQTNELAKVEGLIKTAGITKLEDLTKGIPDLQGKFEDALGTMDHLQDKLNQVEEIKKFIQQRRRFLQEQLGNYFMIKDLQVYKKQVYYYQAQIDEYKKMFDEPSKLEARVLDVLKSNAAFRKFFNDNSQLATLFNLPGSSAAQASTKTIAGLQTISSVRNDMLQRFGAVPDLQQLTQPKVPNGSAVLSRLRDRVSNLTGNVHSTAQQPPDFKPNNQKTIGFIKRLELGTNLQTVKSNKFFPSTTDIGISLGYKLNDKSIIGIGTSYKMGWGKDLRNISFSHQGLGVRSFMDYKLKGSFWLSGGAEMNYRSQFKNFEILDDYSAWQQSALIGLSKKYQVSKKIKGKCQLLYDALWRQQVPRTQPLLFRLGYVFK